MNFGNQITIEIPYEYPELFVEGYEISDDYLSPMKEDALEAIMSDLNTSKTMLLWLFLLRYRTRGEYAFSPHQLKVLFNVSENTLRRMRQELEQKGYLVQIGKNRLRFEPYPPRLRGKIPEEIRWEKEQQDIYKVYKFTFPNGKYYIGKTKRPLEERWQKGEGYRGQRVYEGITEYGWDNIEKEILASDLTANEAAKLEHICIKLYNSIENGYNDIP